MAIKSVKNPRNLHVSIHCIPNEALSPNVHEIKDCYPSGLFGHIYTTDKQGSSWSIHVSKPINVQVEAPIREIGIQGVLIKV